MTKDPGTGLGLATVHSIVQRRGPPRTLSHRHAAVVGAEAAVNTDVEGGRSGSDPPRAAEVGMNRAGTLWKPFLLFSALHPSMRELFPERKPRDNEPHWSYLGLLFAGSLIAPAIEIAKSLTANPMQPNETIFVSTASSAVTLLILLRMVGFVRVAKQSTALALQNERLLQLDRLKDDFVASVSHELRTPLTSIRGYLELVLLEEAGKLQPEQRECLEIAERNGERLLHLVDDLLFVAQGNAGRLEFTFAETDLRTLAVETVESARPMAEDRGITLTSRIGNVEPAMVDRIRIAQLLDNLLSNALKFTPQGGKVRVRVAAGAGVAVLEVGDTGTGISAEDQQRLFERFYRSESTKRRAVPGTGLGLSIAKAIAEAHGGTITVTSAVGEGTLFRVELPLTQAAHSNADALEAAA